MDGDSLQVIILLLLVACSAFFSGTETAFTCVNKTKMSTLAQGENKKAKIVLDILNNYDKFLFTMFIGNNIVNIAAASIATVSFTRWFNGDSNLGAVVSTIAIAVLILIFGEISPKTIAKDHSEGYSLAVSGIVKTLMIVFSPLTLFFGLWQKLLEKIFKKNDTATVTEEEIITLVDEAQSDGEIGEHEGEIIKNVIDFGDLDVSEILIPRVDIISVATDMPFEEIKNTFRKSGFSRLPVYGETIDDIIGIIHEKDFSRLLQDGKNQLKPIINKPLFISEGTKLTKLLKKFQAEKTHMAIALDEYGGTAGLVTLEDVLEILVGEIWDEHDKIVENIRKIGDNTYIVNGATALTEIQELYMFPEDVYDEFVTVNGWVLENLQKVPEVKDKFTYDNLSVEVSKVKDRRAEKVKIIVTPKQAEDDDNSSEEKEGIFGFKVS